MGIFRNLGAKFGEHKRMLGGALALTGIAVAVFFAGAWAASSGTLTLGTTPASAAMNSHAMNTPPAHASDSDDSCCDKPMPGGEMGPNMPKHGGMSPGEKSPSMPMEPGKPMPKSDKMCCEKH